MGWGPHVAGLGGPCRWPEARCAAWGVLRSGFCTCVMPCFCDLVSCHGRHEGREKGRRKLRREERELCRSAVLKQGSKRSHVQRYQWRLLHQHFASHLISTNSTRQTHSNRRMPRSRIGAAVCRDTGSFAGIPRPVNGGMDTDHHHRPFLRRVEAGV